MLRNWLGDWVGTFLGWSLGPGNERVFRVLLSFSRPSRT